MTYTIIGGDGKEYGPITAQDVRQWIAEGRLNEQTMMKAESDAAFRALEKFPEFADVFGGTPAVPTIPPIQPSFAEDVGRAAALKRIKVPALGLKIVAILNLILSLWGLEVIFSPPDLHEVDAQLQQLNNPQLTDFVEKTMHIMSNVPLVIANVVFGVAISILIFMGASKMQSLRSYEFSFTAAVLSVIPCLTPCCGFVIGLAFGIWALVLLLKPEIKSQFK